MKNQTFPTTQSLTSTERKRFLILAQFFLIIFIYHTLKDLKDTIVITASDAGAEVIPFIKIWAMLPLAIVASFLFSKLYNYLGREKTLYFFVGGLLSAYAIFAFLLFPFRDDLYLNHLAEYLKFYLPIGAKGFIAMVCYWHYTLFYLASELWSLLILSVLFWGYVNETSSYEEAKKFYPLCMFTGNFAGILSGQVSYYLCHHLTEVFTWQQTLQLMISLVMACGFIIMGINRLLSIDAPELPKTNESSVKEKTSFKDNLLCIVQSGPLFCIAVLVVGYGLTSNLIEVVWKESIRSVHSTPEAYNAYINQLTSIIGMMAVGMAFLSRWIFRYFTWSSIALITPTLLFFTSSLFFTALLLPQEYLTPFSSYLGISSMALIILIGSIHYVLGLTAKYTIFDATKEMAFFTIPTENRIRAKSVIDSIGSRLGKSGSSCLYQALLITFGSTVGHLPIIGIASIVVIGVSIFTTKKLGGYMKQEQITLPVPD